MTCDGCNKPFDRATSQRVIVEVPGGYLNRHACSRKCARAVDVKYWRALEEYREREAEKARRRR